MLQYFRLNDPYRFVTIILLLLSIRLPYYLLNDLLYWVDLRYLLLGEKIAGGQVLYTDIQTSVPILAGLTFGLIDVIFGKSIVVYHVLSFLLVAIQAYLVNGLINYNKATTDPTYYPALLYILFFSLSPHLYSLSPEGIGLTFIILALNFQFQHLEFRVKRDEKILGIGFYIGISSMFFHAGVYYMVVSLLVMILFTKTLYRRYLLLLFGFCLPYLLFACYYIYKGSLDMYVASIFMIPYHFEFIVPNVIILVAPAVMLALSFLLLLQTTRLTNFQNTLNQAMLLWLLFSFLVYFMTSEKEVSVLSLFAIPVVFFLTHYLVIKKRGWLKSLVFYLFFISVIGLNLTIWIKPELFSELYKTPRRAEPGKWENMTLNKSILVLGPDLQEYRNASHGSFFFDWKLSESLFRGPLTYSSIVEVYEGIRTDPPEVIIDEENLFEKFRDRIPEFQNLYKRSGKEPLWVKVSNN